MPAAIGFIAVFGVAMLNVVLVAYLIRLRDEGLSLEEVARRGCSLQLRPVLMTATVPPLQVQPPTVRTGIFTPNRIADQFLHRPPGPQRKRQLQLIGTPPTDPPQSAGFLRGRQVPPRFRRPAATCHHGR